MTQSMVLKMINWKVHNERYTVRFVLMHAFKTQLAFPLQVAGRLKKINMWSSECLVSC